jgi:hypothetical protein
MAQKPLPKIIYVAWEDAANPYLSANENIGDHAICDETTIVGVYELKELQEVILEVKSTVRAKRISSRNAK